jgi:hypothetical protein
MTGRKGMRRCNGYIAYFLISVLAMTGSSSYAANPASTAYVDAKVAALQAQIDLIKPGDSYGGGTVFYLDNSTTPRRGLIAATSDATVGGGTYAFSANNSISTSRALFTGNTNTANMNAQPGGSSAANAATSYTPVPTCSAPLLSCTGWYLPSEGELNLLWAQYASGLVSGFSAALYWCSTQNDSGTAFDTPFDTGGTTIATKSTALRVRPIRAFTY